MPQTSKDDHYNAVSNAISRVLIPVMLCMALSVWFVHSLGDIDECKKASSRSNEDTVLYSDATSSTTNNGQFSNVLAAIFIGIFIVLVVVFTFLMVWLYKSGHRRVIQIWLFVSVFLILSYVGGVYMFDFFRSHCINIDWITLVLAVWNFSVTGLFAVFGRVPRFVNQLYLIVISALMAYIFRTLPAFAVWIILALLVVWDLFAVLSKFGPLNLLVQAAKEQQEELPALVYDTNPVAPGREPHLKSAKASSLVQKKRKENDETANPPSDVLMQSNQIPPPSTANAPSSVKTTAATSTTPSGANASNSTHQQSNATNSKKSPANLKKLFRRNQNADVNHDTTNDTNTNNNHTSDRNNDNNTADAARNEANTNVDNRENNENENANSSSRRGNKKIGVNADGEVQVGTLGTHLKLGLGDFVFYSILVAQASRSGPMSTIASFVAILAGLCATLFLVTVKRKALPALPISITAGLIVYFLTEYSLLPYAETLLPRLLFH